LTQERRRFARIRHRVGCEFEIDGRRHTGIIGNVSPRGLFVQSTVQPAEGTEFELALRPTPGSPLALRVAVVRHSRSHRSAAAVSAVGFAVEITWAPESYYALLLALGSG